MIGAGFVIRQSAPRYGKIKVYLPVLKGATTRFVKGSGPGGRSGFMDVRSGYVTPRPSPFVLPNRFYSPA